jgi:hypothetical protein
MVQKSAGKSARQSSRKPSRRGGRRWSARVTRESDALDLQHRVFTGRDPKKIAASLKRSAERSRRRKSNAYRSALSMLTFYINRAGKPRLIIGPRSPCFLLVAAGLRYADRSAGVVQW